MRLADVLFTQGFGTRRECAALLGAGLVRIDGAVRSEPNDEVDPEGLAFAVDGERWVFQARAVIAMYKPAGHECSQKPRHHPSVYALLPLPLRRRG
ncbi:MAG: S4 domain-containing protein, partial [Caldimonas sp.]